MYPIEMTVTGRLASPFQLRRIEGSNGVSWLITALLLVNDSDSRDRPAIAVNLRRWVNVDRSLPADEAEAAAKADPVFQRLRDYQPHKRVYRFTGFPQPHAWQGDKGLEARHQLMIETGEEIPTRTRASVDPVAAFR